MSPRQIITFAIFAVLFVAYLIYEKKYGTREYGREIGNEKHPDAESVMRAFKYNDREFNRMKEIFLGNAALKELYDQGGHGSMIDSRNLGYYERKMSKEEFADVLAFYKERHVDYISYGVDSLEFAFYTDDDKDPSVFWCPNGYRETEMYDPSDIVTELGDGWFFVVYPMADEVGDDEDVAEADAVAEADGDCFTYESEEEVELMFRENREKFLEMGAMLLENMSLRRYLSVRGRFLTEKRLADARECLSEEEYASAEGFFTSCKALFAEWYKAGVYMTFAIRGGDDVSIAWIDRTVGSGMDAREQLELKADDVLRELGEGWYLLNYSEKGEEI